MFKKAFSFIREEWTGIFLIGVFGFVIISGIVGLALYIFGDRFSRDLSYNLRLVGSFVVSVSMVAIAALFILGIPYVLYKRRTGYNLFEEHPTITGAIGLAIWFVGMFATLGYSKSLFLL